MKILFFLGIFFLNGVSLWAVHPCEGWMDNTDGVDIQAEIKTEMHTLLEVVDLDPEQNLMVAHPFSVLDAASRFIAVAQFGGVQEVADPSSPMGRVNYYPIFSAGTRLTDGRAIVGHWRSIHQLVEMIKSRGDRIPLLVGPRGTGKTEFSEILGTALERLTSRHPDFYVYRHTWRGLGAIDSLRDVLAKSGNQDGVIPCPINDSPLAILPEGHQKVVLTLAAENVGRIVGGLANPMTRPCHVCAYVRGEILGHFGRAKLASLKDTDRRRLDFLRNKSRRGVKLSEVEGKEWTDLRNKGELSDDEIVEVLGRHIDIRRLVFDRSESFPVIDVQPRDVDWHGLVASPHPLIRTFYGPSHPLAWHLNGLLLRANGSGAILDELLRQPEDFKNVALRLLQSREVVIGGMPPVPMDAVFIGISNLEKMQELAKDKGLAAFLDRQDVVPFFWSTRPHEIGRLLLLLMQKKMSVVQQRLGKKVIDGGKETSWGSEAGDLNLLFPTSEPGQPLQGPDLRYKVWIERHGQRIHVSPRVLLFMAQVLGATRISTDPKAAEKVLEAGSPDGILKSNAFRDVITRLRIYMGEERPPEAQLIELSQLSRRLHEGTFGVSSRDGESWLGQALAEAAKSENGGCLTPQVAIGVLRGLLDTGGIQFPDNQTRTQWELLMKVVAKNLLVRDLKKDIDTAYTRDTGEVDSTYREIVYEIMARHDDLEATHYIDRTTNQRRAINFKRLDAIRKKYKELCGRELSDAGIALQHLRNWAPGQNSPIVPDTGLRDAIVAYFAELTLERVRIVDLRKVAETGEGGEDAKHAYRTFMEVMIQDLGYCERCILSAFDFAVQVDSRKGQVE